MKNCYFLSLATLLAVCFSFLGADFCFGDSRQSYNIVNDSGILKRSDTGEEVAYYGTNYTLPFAHSYRWMKRHGEDFRKVITGDVYHFKRLGMNAFRLHLWDVELADSAGALTKNEHLELLDYLLWRLRENGIDVILTAQTNFGNGYPEKNENTGSYSYIYDKCEVHRLEASQQAQERYLRELMTHINPFTGLSYGEDNGIIGIEINNEPCHSGATEEEVTSYIDRMSAAIRSNSRDKLIFYNVSHNDDVRPAYYKGDIDATTYQWYPTGLVSGHLRKGNFLPLVDSYEISWKDTIAGYDRKPRIFYEFDPGDVLVSYLYPAIARTMRTEGFQWLTQFAYDSTPMAGYNTDYQTHYLNLAYTPAKSLGMLTASEVMQNIARGERFEIFPNDTVFGDFRLSASEDLAEYAAKDKFYYTNTTTTQPKSVKTLRHIAGHGSSPVVEYGGSGAYFLDRLEKGLWRLEVMPDVILTEDPFEKPSERRKIGRILYSEQPIKISLPELGKSWYFRGINSGNTAAGQSENGGALVTPGVYLLSSSLRQLSKPASEEARQYFAPAEDRESDPKIVNTASQFVAKGDSLDVKVEVAWHEIPDSVILYPSNVSFWRDNNELIPLSRQSNYEWSGKLPISADSYNIVVHHKGRAWTFPEGYSGTPLDWDRDTKAYYSVSEVHPEDAIILLNPGKVQTKNLDFAVLPEWNGGNINLIEELPKSPDYYSIYSNPESESIMRVFTGDILGEHPFASDKKKIVVKGNNKGSHAILALNLKNGRTLSHSIDSLSGEIAVSLDSFAPAERIVIPAPYPTFLSRRLPAIEGSVEIGADDIESVEIRVADGEMHLEGIWVE